MPPVLGIVFLLALNGDLLEAPQIFPFASMSDCQSAREELHQYVSDNLVSGEVHMACIPSEAFK